MCIQILLKNLPILIVFFVSFAYPCLFTLNCESIITLLLSLLILWLNKKISLNESVLFTWCPCWKYKSLLLFESHKLSLLIFPLTYESLVFIRSLCLISLKNPRKFNTLFPLICCCWLWVVVCGVRACGLVVCWALRLTGSVWPVTDADAWLTLCFVEVKYDGWLVVTVSDDLSKIIKDSEEVGLEKKNYILKF